MIRLRAGTFWVRRHGYPWHLFVEVEPSFQDNVKNYKIRAAAHQSKPSRNGGSPLNMSQPANLFSTVTPFVGFSDLVEAPIRSDSPRL